MGGNSKRFLKEETIPTIFSFFPETTRKHWESSIRRAEMWSDIYFQPWSLFMPLQGLELSSEKCICMKHVIAVAKGVGK